MTTSAQPRTGRVRRKATLGRLLWRIAGIVSLLLVLIYVGISAYAADRFSHPLRQSIGQCSDYHLNCEDVQFQSTEDGILLRGWYIRAQGTRTIIMLHGRNGRRDDPAIGMMDIAAALVAHGYDVLTFDFRAHGESGGDRYSLGDWEQRDVAGALHFVQGRGIHTIGVIGFSMGAATALNAAPDHPEMQALVLDSSFSDLEPVIARHLTEVSGLPTFFTPGIVYMAQGMFGMDLADNRPADKMARLGDRPVLLIHSTTDGYVPVSQAYALEQAGSHDPHLEAWILTGPDHTGAFKNAPATYLQHVLPFFDKYLVSKTPSAGAR